MVVTFLTILLIDHLSSPVKGIINTTIAIPSGMSQDCHRLFDFRGGLTFTIHPSGIVHILDSMHEGLHNTPKLYGSDVRNKGKVTDFKSGVKEGGKVGISRSHAEMIG